MGFFSGVFLSNAVSYYTADVERVEDMTVIDSDIDFGTKGRRNYYLTIKSPSFACEEVSVPKYIYEYAQGPLEDDLVVVFAKDIFGQEFYTIELDY
jgi:hypothetical protein